MLGIGILVCVGAIVPTRASAANPHTSFTNEGSNCGQCHAPHQAATGDAILKDVAGTGGDLTPVTFCYGCHDGSAAVNVKTGVNNATFEGLSGHSVEAVDGADGDLTNVCSDCHEPHADTARRFRLAETTITVTLPNGTTAERAVSGADNTWCLACHDDGNSWYASTTETPYPQPATPSLNASGYPVTGTFPGASVYNDASKNGHQRIPAGSMADWAFASREVTRVAGDCLWCHSGHRGMSEYDGLIDTFGASSSTAADTVDGDYAAVCFRCHSATPASGMTFDTTSTAADIAGSALTTVYDESATNGHRIMTAGGDLPVGSPLPCYECHNPHGSKNGNTTMISDALGSSLDPTASALENRYFCFTCHTTQDTGIWYGSDGTQMVAVATGTTAVGLDRTDGDNKLTLSGASMHSRTATTGCAGDFGCHGSVHNPNGGVSTGGQDCYQCHGSYQEHMESTSPTAALSYHHVLGGNGYAGDEAAAFYQGAYPSTVGAADTDVYCLSCHVDHDKFFNGAAVNRKGYNLRETLTAAPNAANSDYNDTNGGICLGCHSTSLMKSTAQKTSATESSKTPAITVDQYRDKAHDYNVPSTFSGTVDNTYNANCVKCHNDEEAQKTGAEYIGYQVSGASTPPHKFGTHWSAENRLAAALTSYSILTASLTSTEETLCFKCHDGDTTTSTDGYGVTPNGSSMTPSSQNVKNQFDLNFTHGVDDVTWDGVHTSDETAFSSTNKHVECEDCHNPHAAGKTIHTAGGVSGNAIGADSPLRGVWGVSASFTGQSWPSSWWTLSENMISYAVDPEADYEYRICFKCHSGFNQAYDPAALDAGNNPSFTWGGSGADAWTNVALEFNPNNGSYHPVLAPAGNSQTWLNANMDPEWRTPNQLMTCTDCHGASSADPAAQGPHGSTVDHILKGYWPENSDGVPYAIQSSSDSTAYAGLLCDRCHIISVAFKGHWKHVDQPDAQNCYRCHIVVPHGGKLPGLVADCNDDMPSRYAYENDKTNVGLAGYGGDPDRSNSCDGTGCHTHDRTGNIDNPDW